MWVLNISNILGEFRTISEFLLIKPKKKIKERKDLDLMRTSWRFLSRLLHSSKRTAVLNPSSPFNVFINDNNGKFFSILEHTNQFRGFCSVHCSKRFVLLGLVSFDNSGSNQHHKYSSNRSKYFVFACLFYFGI